MHTAEGGSVHVYRGAWAAEGTACVCMGDAQAEVGDFLCVYGGAYAGEGNCSWGHTG